MACNLCLPMSSISSKDSNSNCCCLYNIHDIEERKMGCNDTNICSPSNSEYFCSPQMIILFKMDFIVSNTNILTALISLTRAAAGALLPI
jgi:hypothetical protein